MKKDYTHIAFVLDRSGSMSSSKIETIKGFNSFLQEQQGLEGKATFTLVQFDDQYEVWHDFVDIQKVKKLKDKTYVPRGMTALFDAIGKTINIIGKKLSDLKEEERPEKVVFVILTDGQENSSLEYRFEVISDMIKHQTEKYNWTFVFLGSELSAVDQAINMGISSSNTLNYSADAEDVQILYKSVSSSVSKLRMAKEAKMDFFSEDEKASYRSKIQKK
ncbi:MAG: VWA domain-containing protein [Leptospiraceae bacterium]|nr:VWA domain-containing protein [Leptospiraceae bacterium]MCP5496147.1 VWA domain-containing protein [Leptospiraceae bacterium]